MSPADNPTDRVIPSPSREAAASHSSTAHTADGASDAEAAAADSAADRVATLARRVIGGDVRALARALSVVERGDETARALVGALVGATGRARIVGVSGAGGAGKSSLIARLVAAWRARGHRVGVVAVDPSSAISGGALLGDRVRMEDFAGDRDVFVRSMATRGQVGGLARAAVDATRVLDAAGFAVIVLETIGVGQDQLAIAWAAETVAIVEAPNMGDDVQALKAGLSEIADIFVVNKGDQPGADRAVAHIRAALSLDPPRRGWVPPIVKTSAATGAGIAGLVEAVEAHWTWLGADNGRERQRRAEARARAEIEALVREAAIETILARAGEPNLAESSRAVATGRRDPYAAAQAILGRAGLARASVESR